MSNCCSITGTGCSNWNLWGNDGICPHRGSIAPRWIICCALSIILRNHVNSSSLQSATCCKRVCCFIALKNICETTNISKANNCLHVLFLFVFFVSYVRLKVPERSVECHHSGDGDQGQRAQASPEWPAESRRDPGWRSTSCRWARCNGENSHQVCSRQPHSPSRRNKRAKNKNKLKLQWTKHSLN